MVDRFGLQHGGVVLVLQGGLQGEVDLLVVVDRLVLTLRLAGARLKKKSSKVSRTLIQSQIVSDIYLQMMMHFIIKDAVSIIFWTFTTHANCQEYEISLSI